jgi:predicted transposase YbfD/YdcC
METPAQSSILAHFSLIEDPRRNHWNTLHRLYDILTIALCAVLGGADGWDDIADFGRSKHAFFTDKLKLENGLPSSDTFRRVIASIDPECFAACFLSWIEAAVGQLGGDFVGIDGKTLRGSYEKDDPKAAIHMVSAWAHANRMILGQYKVESKSNEITAIPKLLEMLDLKGCLVTIDAMGCQREIARQIHEQGADYILALKGNQSTLHGDVKTFFTEAKARDFNAMEVSFSETVNLGHARREVRRCWVCDDVMWLDGFAKWAGLSSMALIEYRRDVYSDGPTEQRYYISSRSLEAEAMIEAVRSHWGIENKVHWVLDVSFGEDASRIRRDHGAENFSVMRRVAVNLLRQDETSKRKSIKGRRKQAGWDNDYLGRLLGF